MNSCTETERDGHSGVKLRSILMYEPRKKDINKARAESVHRMDKVLGCTIEHLIEEQFNTANKPALDFERRFFFLNAIAL